MGIRKKALASAAPAVIPVQALCGELEIDGAPRVIYETEIDVAFQPSGEEVESGEIIVSPDILAGEVNPGETIHIRCEDILQGRRAYSGLITIQAYPPEEFTVRVTYRAHGA